MADTKLSALTALATEPADTDEFYINDGGTSKKIAWSTIKAVFALAAQGATADTALQDVVDDTSPTLGGDLSLGGFKLLSGASNNAIIKLGDNAGTRKLSITDSDDVEVAYINSDGSFVPNAQQTSAGLIKRFNSGIEIQGGGIPWRLANGSEGGVNAHDLWSGGMTFQRNQTQAITIKLMQHSNDSNPTNALTIQGQNAHAAAATNVNGGSVTIQGGASATGSGNGGDVILTPGTGTSANGFVKFGTHASVSGETLSGYIIIKDAGGTERKLAVVS